jgi:hypothetical protein
MTLTKIIAFGLLLPIFLTVAQESPSIGFEDCVPVQDVSLSLSSLLTCPVDRTCLTSIHILSQDRADIGYSIPQCEQLPMASTRTQ